MASEAHYKVTTKPRGYLNLSSLGWVKVRHLELSIAAVANEVPRYAYSASLTDSEQTTGFVKTANCAFLTFQTDISKLMVVSSLSNSC